MSTGQVQAAQGRGLNTGMYSTNNNYYIFLLLEHFVFWFHVLTNTIFSKHSGALPHLQITGIFYDPAQVSNCFSDFSL